MSEVEELRAEVARLTAELEGEKAAELFMTVLYTSALRHVEGERDRARALAVRLEQEATEMRDAVWRARFQLSGSPDLYPREYVLGMLPEVSL